MMAPMAGVCVPGEAGGVTWLECSLIPLCLAVLQTEQQHHFLPAGQVMFWPTITAPDVLPQKQFKGRRNCEQIVFLVESV